MWVVRLLAFLTFVLFGTASFTFTQSMPDFHDRAAHGDAEAMFALGYMYETGKGKFADPNRAIYWYEAAAEKGYGPAMNNLAVMFMNGDGVARDYLKAVDLLRKAARLQVVEARANLGQSYREGLGVPQNPSRGKNLIKIASSRVPPPGFETVLRDGWARISPPLERDMLDCAKGLLSYFGRGNEALISNSCMPDPEIGCI